MKARGRVALVGLVSPRLHYHDDVSRSGAVYVGYIGRHLPTMGMAECEEGSVGQRENPLAHASAHQA